MLRVFPVFLLGAAVVLAQGQPPRVVSPEVHADRTVTFRLRAPNAQKVSVNFEGGKPLEMTKGADGVWTATSPVREPDMLGYMFVVDGVQMLDPVNPLMKPNLLNPNSMVHLAGGNVWDVADVPRGVVHRHFYKSASVGDNRDFYVYTPPGYDAKGKTKYPVLYLLHGFSDDASGWTAVGNAHVIMDNLIAQGKAKPMLVVMPLGYGAPDVLTAPRGPTRDASLWSRNETNFTTALMKEVIPMVEKNYKVSAKREDRAIAGLSMGGGQSLRTGLNNTDTFAWVGAFSSATMGFKENFDTVFPGLNDKVNGKLKLLWIGIGKDDFLFKSNNEFDEALKARNIKHEYKVTEGAHTWMVWRRYLSELTPQLFR